MTKNSASVECWSLVLTVEQGEIHFLENSVGSVGTISKKSIQDYNIFFPDETIFKKIFSMLISLSEKEAVF
jgi:hypothetical protein